jgi:hypothetical protein
MKKYTKVVNGKTICEEPKYISIKKDGMITYNPSEEMLLEDGWVEYVEPTKETTIETIKKQKSKEINRYDNSKNVNEFFINEISLWLDKTSRLSLKFRLESEKKLGIETTTIWYNGLQFTVNIDDAFNMLYSLESYAAKCYDNTQQHLANINTLQTIEDVKEYDYKVGYPEKLHFSI